MRNARAHLVCFLVGHDLGLYRLVCHRCHNPDADTLADVCQRLLQQLKTRRGNSDELPF